MNLFTSKTAKVVAGVVGLALALAFVVTPVTSKAATNEELTAQINALLAQIAALQGQVGGSTSGSYTFSADLTVGSTGADVTALQNILISGGFLNMPAGTAKGYFGSLTASAVKAWQASAGLPSTGFVGPLSRAKLNAMGGSMGGSTGTYPAGCTSNTGFSSTTGMSCAGSTSLPAGCTSTAGYSTSTGMPCSGGTATNMNGSDGSVTLSYVSYAPASQTLKKGDMNKPVISVKLQAVNGQVAVTRFDVHFSERPWLDFGSVTLTDSTGAVLATKTLSGAADATEVTVGSDYLVRFDNVNVNVTPGTDKILAVAVNVLNASDKITGQTVYTSIPSGSIRTINGKGYTDSVGLSSGIGSGLTSSTGNAVTLSSTGSTGDVYTRVDPSAPASNRIIVTSATQATPNVTLGVFGIKVQNQNATINSMSFNINNSTQLATSSLLSNLRLQIGGQTYGANALTAGNTTFTNMSVPATQDTWITAKLIADITANIGSTAISASSTLVKASIVGVDSNFNTLTLLNASNQSSTDNIYSLSGVQVTSPTAVIGTSCTGGTSTSSNTICPITFSFTVTNVGNSDIFISKTPYIALSTTSSATVGGTNYVATSTVLQSINIPAGTGDTSASYDVASGASRTFTYSGSIVRAYYGSTGAGTPSFQTFRVGAIKFGTVSTDGNPDVSVNSQTTTASTNTASLINFGLESLYVSQAI